MDCTHSLKGLEDAVEEKVPIDFAIFKGRNVPNEEIGNHSQRSWEQDPSDGQSKGKGNENNVISGWKRDLIRAWNTQIVETITFMKRGATHYITDYLSVTFSLFVPNFLYTDSN